MNAFEVVIRQDESTTIGIEVQIRLAGSGPFGGYIGVICRKEGRGVLTSIYPNVQFSGPIDSGRAILYSAWFRAAGVVEVHLRNLIRTPDDLKRKLLARVDGRNVSIVPEDVECLL